MRLQTESQTATALSMHEHLRVYSTLRAHGEMITLYISSSFRLRGILPAACTFSIAPAASKHALASRFCTPHAGAHHTSFRPPLLAHICGSSEW